MLVDDQLLFREGIKSLLKTHDGIEIVAEAEEGATAIKIAPDVAPDVFARGVARTGLEPVIPA